MDQTAPSSDRTDQDRPLPPCIAMLLGIVRVFLGYSRRLTETVPQRVDHPRFPTLAAAFGTHDVHRILAHVRRGLLRAMMLERLLLTRAAQGHDIEPTPPAGPAQPEDIAALDIKLRTPPRPNPNPNPNPAHRPAIDPNDPQRLFMPDIAQMEAEVRRRSVGRTIVDICLDLGIAANNCDGAFWSKICQALMHFDGDFERLFEEQKYRRETFLKERDKLPETWTFDWQERPKDAIRQIVGFLAGEPP